ncbi:MAG: arabinosyltransferase domain-containing protein [Nocardiaceae bacterium]|nr:arabinosyltransferase domain-containing protein [Nocardiaceae bacterium]
MQKASPNTARIIAIVTGLIGFLCAIALPVMPVKATVASLDWPQRGAGSVTAPLVSYTPVRADVTVPCSVLTAPGALKQTIVATIPDKSDEQSSKGLVITVEPALDGAPVSVRAILRDKTLINAPLSDFAGCQQISIASDVNKTVTKVGGVPRLDNTKTDDLRPQVVGLFTDLPQATLQTSGIKVHIDIDSRFTTSTTLIKTFAMIVAVLTTIISLVALHRLDCTDGRRARRFLPAHWYRISLADVFMIGTLGIWYVIGANTSDDGYLLTMGRAAGPTGYMSNYYRWFGVPEAPFGWAYDILTVFSHISTTSMFMRLPTLAASIIGWLVISREVLPRLGARVRRNQLALWTSGLVYLAFWLPYDNGLRPEPIIALGALLTWCSAERAIATGRLLPAAIAVMIAAFSLAAGPTGLICIAALAASSRPLLQILIKRAKTHGFAALLAPIAAAGTLILVPVFRDQTLAAVKEASRVRMAVGPNVAWFDERLRWDALLTFGPDGSLARRFGVLIMLVCLATCVMQMLRKGGQIPGTSRGPSIRILGIVFGALLMMMWTPTKWTHHFGVYAGLAGSVAALAAVAVGQRAMTAPRNRTLFAAFISFFTAIAFTGPNGWWYVSSYGIPWWDKPVMIAGKGISTLFLAGTVLLLLIAAYQHYRAPYIADGSTHRVFRDLAAAPLTVIAAFMVMFEVLSFVKGAVSQYPAYSIAKSNLEALAGHPCSLADNVLVEPDPTSSILKPLRGPLSESLQAENVGFTPDGVPIDISAESEWVGKGGANSTSTDGKSKNNTPSSTAGGYRDTVSVNGSKVELPYGLDPAEVPSLGSWTDGDQRISNLTTQWFGLDRKGPLLTVAAAGWIHSVDKDGVVTEGQDVMVEYGIVGADGNVEKLGEVRPIDIGPQPSWRDLRVPLSQIPDKANAVRVVVTDDNISPGEWVAITPPRVPIVKTLQEYVGSQVPVLLDWSVGLAFPCQRPFEHVDGVAEVPEFRIMPDRKGAEATNGWQDWIGGGPLGWTSLLLKAQSIPSFANNDWARDWGNLERLVPYDGSETTAHIETTEKTRTGLYSDGRIKESS